MSRIPDGMTLCPRCAGTGEVCFGHENDPRRQEAVCGDCDGEGIIEMEMEHG